MALLDFSKVLHTESDVKLIDLLVTRRLIQNGSPGNVTNSVLYSSMQVTDGNSPINSQEFI